MSRMNGLVKVDLPSEYAPFTRAELIAIRERSKFLAKPPLNEDWSRAYLVLADAADRIDAMQARTVIAYREPTESGDHFRKCNEAVVYS
jgi:hypothetical protein